MSRQSKTGRSYKAQKGQFLTPMPLAQGLTADINFGVSDRVLEPGFGDGSFLIPVIAKFLPLYDGPVESRLKKILQHNVWGVEICPVMHQRAIANIREQFGAVPDVHNLILADFLDIGNGGDSMLPGMGAGFPPEGFTHVIGNPPFGGTIPPKLHNRLEKQLGHRYGMKIKKETYAWFVVKCVELLSPAGWLRFICSDTFLTIYTMRGLRNMLMSDGVPSVNRISRFSEETSYPMVVLDWHKTGAGGQVTVEGTPVETMDIRRTVNLSWGLTADMVKFFRGPVVGDFMVCTGGMTTGNNRLFVRKIEDDGTLLEPYVFDYGEEPITLAGEISRSQRGVLSATQESKVRELMSSGATRRVLMPALRDTPLKVVLPDGDYVPYNKAVKQVVYHPPTHQIFWKDKGDAVLTYKKTGKWYLRGVGGRKFYGRSGLTWRLVSSSLDVRFLPEGYVLDSGSPCGFLRDGIQECEMWFIMGWLLTGQCNQILKQVINHTMNIQGKDVERLPYPFWVDRSVRAGVADLVRRMVSEGQSGRMFRRDDPEFRVLEEKFRMPSE